MPNNLRCNVYMYIGFSVCVNHFTHEWLFIAPEMRLIDVTVDVLAFSTMNIARWSFIWFNKEYIDKSKVSDQANFSFWQNYKNASTSSICHLNHSNDALFWIFLTRDPIYFFSSLSKIHAFLLFCFILFFICYVLHTINSHPHKNLHRSDKCDKNFDIEISSTLICNRHQ